jgi:formylglycine-generating enzyme required for sulfatase activity
MIAIERISFVGLTGEPPVHLQLQPLPHADHVAALVEQSLMPFGTAGCRLERIGPFETISPSTIGLHAVYIYGHAWLANGRLTSSVAKAGASIERPLVEMLEPLLAKLPRDRTILVLDCCHAASIRSAVATSGLRMVVYACAPDEKAIALPGERATRLSLALREVLASAATQVSLTNVVEIIATRLDRDDVISGQAVSFDASGVPVRLTRREPSLKHHRGWTVRRVRRRLVVAGGIAVAALTALGWYARNHTILEIDLAGLSQTTTNGRIIATSEYPDQNRSDVVAEKIFLGNSVRLFLPTGNTIVRIVADYPDGDPRALSRHLLTTPSFNLRNKLLRWRLPLAEDLTAHPGMAFVPVTSWIRGRDRDPYRNDTPYWIDIRPPTVTEYAAVAAQLFERGVLKPEDSFVLEGRRNAAAVDAFGLEQLRSLNADLGAIFGVLEAGTSDTVAASGDLVNGLGGLACPTCPAPMTREEARLYCEYRGLSLPTDTQWELAVRGIDGRTFPWGNQFDGSKANVPGLPDKGDPPPALKPVENYAGHLSPFGLFDTVGNAGDWVINTQGDYEAVYMGATWRYNPEDATAFRMLPMTDETSLVREITARCVDQ